MTEQTALLDRNKESAASSIAIIDTTGSAYDSYLRPHTKSQKHNWLERQSKTHLLMGSSCGVWLSCIVLTDHAADVLAWVLLLLALKLCSVTRWLRVRQELHFGTETLFKPELESRSLVSSNKITLEPELEELVAPTIAFFSFALPATLLAIYLFFHIDLNQLKKPNSTRQIVEIELVAPSDAIDRKEILPSSEKEIANKAHKGALYTVASPALTGAPLPRSNPRSNLTSRPDSSSANNDKTNLAIKPKKQPDLLEANKAKAEPKAEPEAKSDAIRQQTPAAENISYPAAPVTFKAPDSWKTVIVAKGKDNSIAFAAYSKAMATKSNSPRNSQALLSEVEPANMIESIDSDGKPTTLTVQSGGRSSNGYGAPSNLHEYLKLLNQKVRNNWIPPRGIDRIAIIEFRISKAGKLVSTKAMPHGAAENADREAEAAAVAALNKTFPFLPLPEELKTTYLDVRYTFNYRFNQISEVSSAQ
ncbi:MAG: hypothetical protein QG574_3710 [Cyanobacteriota bacterium erpe_2018_sw_21hr_WHONDRS-SW48-000092_B_bin.40]|nr:hypothetical protein [Cyanobacteriota bacterium erpe_2018_sw_21hr_WHONDRS-SW48-000092_B_bin.40]